MDNAKQQLADKLKTANNILVTVSRNPSVDQLASCLGLTLLLNKQGKHTAAVFSGEVPSTLEFLQPEDTLEKNTDSLRDFIIALDKSKADKLRYKVEDNVVRIFITPYKTSISEADLDFSQGDFNVDVVVALGVGQQEDLDEAITAHGRILHDATVASINTKGDGGLGTINWYDPQASSLSELVTELGQMLGANLLDSQIATALLTGIVSETERFSNDKTSSQTMSISAVLMAAGANQQLVASKLEEPEQPAIANQISADNNESDDISSKAGDGMIEINHDDEPPKLDEMKDEPADETAAANDSTSDTPPVFEPQGADGTSDSSTDIEPEEKPPVPTGITSSSLPKLMTEPPTLGGTLTANSSPEILDPANDPLGLPASEPPLLDRKSEVTPDMSSPPQVETEVPVASSFEPTPVAGLTPPPPVWVAPTSDDARSSGRDSSVTTTTPTSTSDQPDSPYSTLADLEAASQDAAINPATLDTARDEVDRALNSGPATTQPQATREPIQALNAQPLGDMLHPADPPQPVISPQSATVITPTEPTTSTQDTTDPNAPPPVPPPIPFQFGTPPPAAP